MDGGREEMDTDGQTDRQTDRQTDKQIDRHMFGLSNSQRERDRQKISATEKR